MVAPNTYDMNRRPKLPPLPLGGQFDPEDRTITTDCRRFLDYQFRMNTQKRIELERAWNRARAYDAGRQWLRPMKGTGSRQSFTWDLIRVNRDRAAAFPMPVRNHFSPKIQEEVSRMYGVGARPFIKVSNSEAEDAALLAKRVLIDRNEKSDWLRQQRQGAYHAAMFGQWIESCRWEINQLKTTNGPVTDAVECQGHPAAQRPGCGFNLATPYPDKSPNPGKYSAMPIANVIDMDSNEPPQQMVAGCPNCGGTLAHFDPDQDQVDDQENDAIGHPLWTPRALGEEVSECVSPYGAFPANQGYGYETDEEMYEFAVRTPRSLPWFACRYPNGRLVKADINEQIMQHFPNVTSGSGYSVAMNFRMDGVWDNHALEDIYVQKPSMDFPRGVLLVMGGDTMLTYGELLLEGTDVPGFDMRFGQWELREQEIWGKPLAEDLHSAQDNINSSLSLAMNISGKYAEPKLMLHEGMEMRFAGGPGSAYPGDFFKINMRGIPPEVAQRFPYVFQAKGDVGPLFTMMEGDVEYLKTAGGAYGAETGDVKGVEFNYSALLISSQNSAKRREPRVAGIRALIRLTWRLKLRMIAARYREDRLLHYRDENDKYRVMQFRGLQLEDQTDVMLEDEPAVDSGVAMRASIEQGLKWGTIKTSGNGGTYAADRKINRSIDAPEDLNEDRNAQQDAAKREMEAFLDDGIEPGIDKTGDDHPIHWLTQMGLFGRDPRFEALRDEILQAGVPWPRILMVTWEWDRLLAELQANMDMVRHVPDQAVINRTMNAQQQIEMAAKIKQAQMRITGFPTSLELQIYDVFARLIIASGLAKDLEGNVLIRRVVPSEHWALGSPLEKLIRFLSHALAHYKLAQAPPMVAPPGPAGAIGPGAQPALPPGAPVAAAPPPAPPA